MGVLALTRPGLRDDDPEYVAAYTGALLVAEFLAIVRSLTEKK